MTSSVIRLGDKNVKGIMCFRLKHLAPTDKPCNAIKESIEGHYILIAMRS